MENIPNINHFLKLLLLFIVWALQ